MPTDDHQTLAAMAALLLWPVASLLIFAGCRNLSRGLIWSVLGAQLLLPVGAAIKFQKVPPVEKVTVANFCALAGCGVAVNRIFPALAMLALAHQANWISTRKELRWMQFMLWGWPSVRWQHGSWDLTPSRISATWCIEILT